MTWASAVAGIILVTLGGIALVAQYLDERDRKEEKRRQQLAFVRPKL